jgi:hypothetical protein
MNFFETCKDIREGMEKLRAAEKQRKKGTPNKKKYRK